MNSFLCVCVCGRGVERESVREQEREGEKEGKISIYTMCILLKYVIIQKQKDNKKE